jgi:hypothetical protein
MSLIGYTFIISSRDDEEDSQRYIYARIIVFRSLANVFNAIKKQFRDDVTFTVDVEEFIRKYSGRDFKPTVVGYIGHETDAEDIIVKCVYSED